MGFGALLIIIITSHLGTAPATISITKFPTKHRCERALGEVRKLMDRHNGGIPYDVRHTMTIRCTTSYED